VGYKAAENGVHHGAEFVEKALTPRSNLKKQRTSPRGNITRRVVTVFLKKN
jgi:hypothetical protein